jgi:3-oxoacyl-[acyl-carrier protein] reductase
MTIKTTLEGKVALVTGASSGIGRGVALAMAASGCRVFVNYPDSQEEGNAREVLRTLEDSGGSGVLVQGDVSDEAAVKRMFEEVLDDQGRLDILVNNAGIARSAPVQDITLEDWNAVLAVHLTGTFLCTRQALPIMFAQDAGRIINTASQLAYKGAPGFAHYTAAKGAIISFTRSLTLEIGEKNITANCVAPGATMTPILEDVPPDVLEGIRRGIPRGEIAQVEDIVDSYLFLASDGAGHYRGQCLSPNGGDVFL